MKKYVVVEEGDQRDFLAGFYIGFYIGMISGAVIGIAIWNFVAGQF